MWNDQETNVDLLGHKSIATAIVSLIRDLPLQPLTIGVHGDWGAGKSSVLKMIEEELKEDKNTCCLSFNGWLFQGYDDTKAVLMQVIIEELQRLQPKNKILQKKAKEILHRVDWLRVAKVTGGLLLTGFTGIPNPLAITSTIETLKGLAARGVEGISPETFESTVDTLQTLIKQRKENSVPEEIRAFRQEFEEILSTAEVDRLVVVVDDLDRCLPDTAIETLEAMRLFLFVPRSTFVIAADEEMIAYAVRQRFPELPAKLGPSDYARNYLEKLIQVPFRIPPLGKTEARTYVALLLFKQALGEENETYEKLRLYAANILKRPWEDQRLDEATLKKIIGELDDRLKEAILLVEQIALPLTEGLKGNPRQIKRFLNTLMVRKEIARANELSELINNQVLAKLMLLERFAEPLYRDVAVRASKSPNGVVKEMKPLEEFSKIKPNENGGDVECPDEWKENEWLVAWSKLNPSLADIDLRPYLYISREKSAGFTISAGLGIELEELERKLSSGSPALVKSIESEIKSLSREQSESLFNQLGYKAKLTGDWSSKPPEMDGLYLLCQHHEDLQESLIEIFEGMPVTSLGAWVVVGMQQVFTKESCGERYKKLIDAWGNQDENPKLKTAAIGIKKLTSR